MQKQLLRKHQNNHCYPVKSVLRKGILMALSSDAPVVQNFNPLKGIESAVIRLATAIDQLTGINVQNPFIGGELLWERGK
jgi:predicted amidohydrolase YtcJ